MRAVHGKLKQHRSIDRGAGLGQLEGAATNWGVASLAGAVWALRIVKADTARAADRSGRANRPLSSVLLRTRHGTSAQLLIIGVQGRALRANSALLDRPREKRTVGPAARLAAGALRGEH
jgi:hypothetical protein